MVKNVFLRGIACAVLVLTVLPFVGGRPATGQSSRVTAPPAGETIKAVWTPIPGRAKDLSINAAAMAYAVGDDGVALRWRAVSQKWARMSGAFVRITAAEGNRPWGVTQDGNVMRFNGLWWEPKGDKVADVAGDAVGNIYIARVTGVVEKWEPLSQSWRPVPGQLARRIALDIRGKPWIVTPKGQIMRWEDGAWIAMPGIARDIALVEPAQRWRVVQLVFGDAHIQRLNGIAGQGFAVNHHLEAVVIGWVVAAGDRHA